MKGIHFLVVCFYFLIALYTDEAKAEINLVCNPCSSAVQMHSRALDKVKAMTEYDSTSSSYNVNVISIKNGLVKSFFVTSQPELDRRGELITVVTGRYTATSEDLQNRVNQAYSYFNNIQISALRSVPSSSGLNSAWSLSQNYANHAVLDNWYIENHPVAYWSSQLGSIIGGSFIGSLNGLELQFRFADLYSGQCCVAVKL